MKPAHFSQVFVQIWDTIRQSWPDAGPGFLIFDLKVKKSFQIHVQMRSSLLARVREVGEDLVLGWEALLCGSPVGRHLLRSLCRGTSRIRKCTPPGLYRRPMPRVVRGVLGGWAFSYGRGTPVHSSPYSLHPAPSTIHLHPTPYNLQPTPYTLHPTPHTLHLAPYTLHPTP